MILSLGLAYDLRINKDCKKRLDLSSYYCHLLSKYKELIFVGQLLLFYVMILVSHID